MLVILKTLATPHTVKLLMLKLNKETTEKITQTPPKRYYVVQKTRLSTLFLFTIVKQNKLNKDIKYLVKRYKNQFCEKINKYCKLYQNYKR